MGGEGDTQSEASSQKMKSTIPGLVYPSGRDYFLRTGFGFLDGRRRDDGAEGLWRIRNKLYDLTDFEDKHPGGAEWLQMTQGTDITEAFTASHISLRPEKLLSKYYVREAKTPRSIPFTLEPDGFYAKFKERVREVLKDVDYHNPSWKSKLITDAIVVLGLLSAVGAAAFKSWLLVPVSGLMMAWTAICAHNFFHMKDNFRMYYFDLSMMSSKEWRISHVLSHHLYPNSLWDMEIYALEPFLWFLPHNTKSFIYRTWTILNSPFVWSFSFLGQGIKRYYSLSKEWRTFEFRDVLPFVLPALTCAFAPTLLDGVRLWLGINIVSSFLFSFVGFTAAHHHPSIFHDGDQYRTENLDWGLLELDSIRDRTNIDKSFFLVLTNFGEHILHHLLPTIDHAYLHLCIPALEETCKEFGIYNQKLNSWEMIKGSFRQLARVQKRSNYRGAPDSVVKKSD